MYESNDSNKIKWGVIFKRLAIILGIIILIFGILALITKCSKSTSQNKTSESNYSLKKQLKEMESGTLKYFNKDNLPKEVNSSKTIKLKYLINKDLVGKLKDSEGNYCNENTSYSEITKLDNNYALKVTVTCGKKTETENVYIGCFEECTDGSLCISEDKNQKGICTIEESKQEESNSSSSTETESVESESKTTKESTKTNSQIKTNTNNQTNTKKTTSNKNNSSTGTTNKTNSNSTSNNTQTKTTITKYEYQKCNYVYYCTDGKRPTSDHMCNYIDGTRAASTDGTVDCQTAWSTNSSLGDGWYQTGRTEVISN